MSRGTLGEVRDGSKDLLEGLGRDGGPYRRSETGRKTFPEGPGRVGGLSVRSRMGQGTFGQIRDGPGDPRGGL